MAMTSWLKKYFIPHGENDHRPHFLRRETALLLLVSVIGIEIFFLAGVAALLPFSDFLATLVPSAIVNFANEARDNQNNSSPLRIHPTLQKAAQAKADDMARKGYFAHTSPDGKSPWYWFVTHEYLFRYAGENLAVNFFDSKDMHEAWMRSPKHRANILNKKFTDIGIGIAEGTYNGRRAFFVVQFFGASLPPLQAASSPEAVEKVQKIAFETRPSSSGEDQKTVAGSLVEAVAGAGGSKDLFMEIVASPENTGIDTGAGERMGDGNASVVDEEIVMEKAPRMPFSFSGFIGRIISMPRHLLSFIYTALGILMGTALLLKIFIKIRIQHPRLIVNGIIVILFIGSLIVLNGYIPQFFGSVF